MKGFGLKMLSTPLFEFCPPYLPFVFLFCCASLSLPKALTCPLILTKFFKMVIRYPNKKKESEASLASYIGFLACDPTIKDLKFSIN